MARSWRSVVGVALVIVVVPLQAWAQSDTTTTKKRLEESSSSVHRLIGDQTELDALQRSIESAQGRPEELQKAGLWTAGGGAVMTAVGQRGMMRGPKPGEMLTTTEARLARARRIRNGGYVVTAFGALLFVGGLVDEANQEAKAEELARRQEALYHDMNAEHALQFQILNAQIRTEAAKTAQATSGDNSERHDTPFGGLVGAPGTQPTTTAAATTTTAGGNTAPDRSEKKE